jgi:hypothetical protein
VIRSLVQFALAVLTAVMLSGAACGPSQPAPNPVPDAGSSDGGDDGEGGDAGDEGDGGGDGQPDVDPACLTGGSGGATENLEVQPFTDDAGRTSHFHVYAGKVDTSRTVGLVLHFHGDGAWEFDNPQYRLRQMADLAAAQNLLFVALKSPDRTKGTTWWQSGDANAAWLRDFLDQQIFARYDIDRSRVLLVGYSGGAEFNTHFLVAKHSGLFCGGGALMYGGGGRPYAAKASDFDPGFVEAFRMHWYTGQDDDGYASCSNDGFNGYEAAQRGAARYREFGFTVTEEYPPGIDHCNIPFLDVFEAQLDAGLVSPP